MTEPNFRHVTRSSLLPCAEASGAAIPRVCAVTAFKRELEKSFSVLHCGSGAGIARELRNPQRCANAIDVDRSPEAPFRLASSSALTTHPQKAQSEPTDVRQQALAPSILRVNARSCDLNRS